MIEHHGTTFEVVDKQTFPATTSPFSCIGVIGTAQNANHNLIPFDKPILIHGFDKTLISALGDSGTLPVAVQAILSQGHAPPIVVIRVRSTLSSYRNYKEKLNYQKQTEILVINRNPDNNKDRISKDRITSLHKVFQGDQEFKYNEDWQYKNNHLIWNEFNVVVELVKNHNSILQLDGEYAVLPNQQTKQQSNLLFTLELTNPDGKDVEIEYKKVDTRYIIDVLELSEIDNGNIIDADHYKFNVDQGYLEWQTDNSITLGTKLRCTLKLSKRPKDDTDYNLIATYLPLSTKSSIITKSQHTVEFISESLVDILNVQDNQENEIDPTAYKKEDGKIIWHVKSNLFSIKTNAEADDISEFTTLSNIKVTGIKHAQQPLIYIEEIDWQYDNNNKTIKWIKPDSKPEVNDELEITIEESSAPAEGEKYLVHYSYDNTELSSINKIIGGVYDDEYHGLHSFLIASQEVKIKPRTIAAPGFSHILSVGKLMEEIAEQIGAVAVVDCPDNENDAVKFQQSFESNRVYLCYPKTKFYNPKVNGLDEFPSSIIAGGVMSRELDIKPNRSPSNKDAGWSRGTTKKLPDHNQVNSKVQHLNRLAINCLVSGNSIVGGFYFFGNRASNGDFITKIRTIDYMVEEITNVLAKQRTIDETINKKFLIKLNSDLNFIAVDLKETDIIFYPESIDPIQILLEDNTIANLNEGRFVFRLNFTDLKPAEQIHGKLILDMNYYGNLIQEAIQKI